MITLKQTCVACPEQYDAYLYGEKVGYLRLRHGHFTVTCPGHHGEDIVYEASPEGDGGFDDDERDYYLSWAVYHIFEWVKNGGKKPKTPNVNYEIVFDILAKNEDAVRSAAILADVITSYNKCNNVFSAEWSYEIDKMPKDGSELLVQIVKKDDLMKIKSYAVRWSGDLNTWICNAAYSMDITDYPLNTVALRWAYIPKEY